MRFLHISDLHIGKRIHNIDLIEDQRAVLRQIPEMVKEYGCDAVLIAGDIYDRSQPSEKAIALVDAFLRDLSATGKHIYMISGNHDNQAQVSYLSGILQRSGIYTSVPVSLKPQKYTETDSYREIDIYLLPFLRLSAINRLFPDDPSQTLEEAVSMLLKSYDIDPKRRNVLVCHQFIRGASKGGSEEMSKTIQSTEEAGTASERRPAVVKKGTHTRRGSTRRKGSRTRASADRRKAGRRKKAGRTGFSGSLLIQSDRQNLISMVLAVTVVVLILAAVMVNGISLRKRLKENLARERALEIEIQAERERAADIEEYRKYTGTDAYIEEIAREKLGLIYEGETVFKEER